MKTRYGVKALVAIAIVLLATGMVIATGVFLNVLEATQTVLTVDIETDPDPLPTWSLEQSFSFDVNVSNPTAFDFDNVHLNLTADCPTNGVATLSGDAAGDACGAFLETSDEQILAGEWFIWSFQVTYSDAIGTYTWTFEAHNTP